MARTPSSFAWGIRATNRLAAAFDIPVNERAIRIPNCLEMVERAAAAPPSNDRQPQSFAPPTTGLETQSFAVAVEIVGRLRECRDALECDAVDADGFIQPPNIQSRLRGKEAIGASARSEPLCDACHQR